MLCVLIDFIIEWVCDMWCFNWYFCCLDLGFGWGECVWVVLRVWFRRRSFIMFECYNMFKCCSMFNKLLCSFSNSVFGCNYNRRLVRKIVFDLMKFE